MSAMTRPAATSKTVFWSGWVLSGLAIVFLAFDSLIKVLNMAPAVEATTQLGYAASLVVPLGIVELLCLVIYAIPRTAVFGAILMTGYLGGALATQVRAGASLFALVFPLIIGALVWGGLLLRDERARALLH